jgi:dTDP-4-amino-4,6-dideoxygalactose transaminase
MDSGRPFGMNAGGARPFRISLSDPWLGEEEVRATAEVLASGWISAGPRVAAFEAAFADHLAAKHAIAVASGTAALHLSLLALGIGPGDEVITPSLTFVASAHTVVAAGATPVFADVGPDGLTLDPAEIARRATPRTRAVIAMHYGGHAADMPAILASASPRGLAVIEDAAHAPHARLNGKALGTYGDLGCFSFFSNKNMTSAEGGMVVTASEELARRVRAARSHGMTSGSIDRYQGRASSYDVPSFGLNYRLDEIRAAIGLVQLNRLPAWTERRRELVARYVRALEEVDGLEIPYGPDADSAHHLFVVVVQGGADRRLALVDALRAEGVQTSFHYPPIHRLTWYREGLARGVSLPVTERLAEGLVTLPLHPGLSDEDVDLVCEVISGHQMRT